MNIFLLPLAVLALLVCLCGPRLVPSPAPWLAPPCVRFRRWSWPWFLRLAALSWPYWAWLVPLALVWLLGLLAGA